MSEFNISTRDFLFRFTIPQLFLLVTSRAERNETAEQESKEPQYASLDEMQSFARDYGQA